MKRPKLDGPAGLILIGIVLGTVLGGSLLAVFMDDPVAWAGKNHRGDWLGFAGGAIGGALTLLAAGIAWRAAKPNFDLARLQTLLAAREVLLSMKNQYDAEHLAVEATRAVLNGFLTQLRLAKQVFGSQSSLSWIGDTENALTNFREAASPIFSHMIVGRARLDAGSEVEARNQTIDAFITFEAEMIVLVAEVRQAIYRQPSGKDVDEFESKIRNSELELFLVDGNLLTHRKIVEEKIAGIVRAISEKEIQIYGTLSGHASVSRETDA